MPGEDSNRHVGLGSGVARVCTLTGTCGSGLHAFYALLDCACDVRGCRAGVWFDWCVSVIS